MEEKQDNNIEIPLIGKSKRPLINKIINIGMVLCAIALFIIFIISSQHATISKACCEQLCGEMNMQCSYPSGQDIFCSYSYTKYGFPNINEISRFHIINQSQACTNTLPTNPMPNIVPLTTNNESICADNNTCAIGA